MGKWFLLHQNHRLNNIQKHQKGGLSGKPIEEKSTNLINKFYVKTGVPILLNTSFNDREPIVETPQHAINCFLKTNIDYLYFPEYKILIKKSK